MTIPEENRVAAAKIYATYRQPFLDTIPGALTKQLLIRNENVQVLHGFDSVTHPKDYQTSEMFAKHGFSELQPIWSIDPDVRIYQVKQLNAS